MKTKTPFAIKSIVILFLLGLGVFACNKGVDPPSPPPPPPPKQSTLAILSFDTLNVGATSAKLTWKDSSDAKITSRSITNNNTSEVKNVLSLSSCEFTGLAPNTWYSFTLKVGDATGNSKSSTLSFSTKVKESARVAFGKISYGKAFAIIGNAQSDTLRIKIKNLSSSSFVLPSLNANFGANGAAVKMLRYRFSDTAVWNVIPAGSGAITFKDLPLAPGDNDMKCIFSIKPAPGVDDNAPLTFAFKSMDDGEGGGMPKGGWPAAISTGSVNTHTAPTTLSTNFGWMAQSLTGSLYMSPGGSGFISIHVGNNLEFHGPGPVKLISLKLKNPYASFTGMEWGYPDPNHDFDQWRFGKDVSGSSNGDCSVRITDFYWQDDYINLKIPDGCNQLFADGNNQIFTILCGVKNHSNTMFTTEVYTPGLTGFLLTSRFDFVLENADGQVIDVSDAIVTQDGAALP